MLLFEKFSVIKGSHLMLSTVYMIVYILIKVKCSQFASVMLCFSLCHRRIGRCFNINFNIKTNE